MELKTDIAGVIAPPPLIYFGVLIVGLAVNYFAPNPFLASGITYILGAIFVALGLGLGFASISVMRRANTPLDPWEPTRAIVTNGPYRLTRNPIYVALALVYLGIACGLNALVALFLLPVAILIIHFGVILREEKYLAQKFGEVYLQYQKQVRRWI